ncbi:pyridoxamine 5'-phosphate oxidase family protein [Palleronia caenipelagi]|uniref:Pyridoxamine 5'-phosphate oxidase n=1 Tax=Palleronia caenipelagi TaxID=2489174 RepID=A0A547QAD3_9RHOB|nr:pyridoxamine 5'-phosphate oxidase family protein [Palleronia caenipelagi]TRD23330.1 pyridoxamine 5'-phosphate oxidase [Palleronia caenipelagi]
MNNWFATLDGMRTQAWALMAEGVTDGTQPCRLACLATACPDGGASGRMVVLRKADPPVLEVQTDAASAKIDELTQDPLATLVFWHPGDSLQIRARVRMEILRGPALDPDWEALPEVARLNYGGTPEPGTPLTAAEDYCESVSRDRFAVLRGKVLSLDLVHLGRQMHRRAIYRREDGFAGQWVAP